jgi:hypothetical protein
MNDRCAPHRLYLSPLADGELDLVPEATRAHAAECPACSEEIAGYRLLSDKMLAADAGGARTPLRARPRFEATRRRVTAAVAAALVIAGVGAGGVVWKTSQDEAPIVAAAAAAHQPLLFTSSDTGAIRAWCVRASNRDMPVVSIPGMTPVGARMDRVSAKDVVSVVYATREGGRIAVSWIDAVQSTHGQEAAEARNVAGRTVLLVRSSSGTVEVSGDAPMAELWSAAAKVQAASQ